MHPNKLEKIFDYYIGIPLCIFLGGCKGRGGVRNPPPRRILLIQISAIGDTILTIPTVRAIRRHLPNTHLAMITSGMGLQYLEHCPYLDQHIPLRLDALIQSPQRLVTFLLKLPRQKFDWVIDFEQWSRLSALIAYWSGASRRIGFRAAGQHQHYPFTDVLDHVPGQHEVITFLQIARLLGCPVKETHLEIWLRQVDWDWAKTSLNEAGIDSNKPIVVFHPEAGRRGEPRRRWPHERFVQLADALAERYHAQIILTGAPSEVELSQQIASQTRAPCLVAAGKTKINQLAALFANADVVICSNCGPMHLAAATGTPVIALHGPTNPSQWKPWNTEHTVIN